MKEKEFKMKAARALRQEQTEAEMYLWDLLRNRNFENIKFRRQHPIKDYIVDFFSYQLKLVIELDGSYHNNPDQKEKDELRDLHLKTLGYRVLRYSNNVALTQTHIIYNDISKRKATYKITATSTTTELPSSKGEGLGMRGKTLLSTKKLKPNQRELLLNAGVSFVEYDAIQIKPVAFTPDSYQDLPKIKNVIITSQNGARAFLKNSVLSGDPENNRDENCFCVGEKTAVLLIENGIKVTETAQNAVKLAHCIIKDHRNKEFTYFCGKQRRDELPTILNEAGVVCNEVVVYETYLNERSFDQQFDGILFYSPSGVSAFAKANHPSTSLRVTPDLRAICIGETTASEARKYFETVIVSNATTIESTIAKAVKYLATGA